MFRFDFILSAAIGYVTAFMLTACASPSRVVWEYYDQCSREHPSFLAMAECGRQKRLAECVPNNTCSPEGNMFMEYIDTLGSKLINFCALRIRPDSFWEGDRDHAQEFVLAERRAVGSN